MRKTISTITITLLLIMPLLLAFPVTIAQPTKELSSAIGGGTGGTYELDPSVLYYASSDVTITGDTRIFGNGAMINLNGYDLDITGAYLYIERCYITNGDNGLDFEDGASGFVYKNVIAYNSIGIEIGEEGEITDGCSDITIKENSIVHTDDGIEFYESTDITILENKISNNYGDGIYGDNECLYNDDPNELHNIIIKGNTIAVNAGQYVEIDYVNGLYITSNLMYAADSDDGLELDYCPIVSITHNKILATEEYAIYLSGDSNWPTIDVDGEDVDVLISCTIAYNKIYGNYDYGMYIQDYANMEIIYNEVMYNYDDGIYLDGYDSNFLMEPIFIAYNKISFNEDDGLYLNEYVSEVTVIFNKIEANEIYGMYIYGDDGYSEDLIVKGNVVNGNMQYSMNIEYWDGTVVIEWNTIVGNYYYAYLYDLENLEFCHNTVMYTYYESGYGGAYFDDCYNSWIAHNTFAYNVQYNVYIEDCDGSVFDSNKVIGAYDYNVYCDSTDDLTISNCLITDCYDEAGIYWDGSGLITDNIIGSLDPLSGNYYGIELSSAGTTTIRNNMIVGNYDGIYCSSSDPTIIGNYIAYNMYAGIYLTSNSDPLIGGSEDNRNYIIRNFKDGIHISDSGVSDAVDSGPTITYNNIYWNLYYGIYNDDYVAGDLIDDATNNWYGEIDGPGSGIADLTPDGVGPGSGDEVTAGLDYTPWEVAVIP